MTEYNYLYLSDKAYKSLKQNNVLTENMRLAVNVVGWIRDAVWFVFVYGPGRCVHCEVGV